jgi:NAD+ diphosphatase
MAQPGASSVFYGGSVAYNTKKGKPLLLNDNELHDSLVSPPLEGKNNSEKAYIESKCDWTAKTSVAFCEALNTDFAIAEGGAAGPTFAPKDMDRGFAVLSIAGRNEHNEIEVLKQKVVNSKHNRRTENMRYFADTAAELMLEVLGTDANDMQENDRKDQTVDEVVFLDRATSLRTDSEALIDMRPVAKYVVVHKNKVLVRTDTELALLSEDEIIPIKGENDQVTFLGLLSNDKKTPIFGIDVIGGHADDFIPHSCTFADTRTTAPLFPPLENALALHMMAYANWQRNSTFCSLCGSPVKVIHAGTTHQCTSCNALSWPRQDPSMIASITSRCGEKILLARSKRHPPKMHTVLAGFVEAGETFEAAVAREVWEETGIRIDTESLEYVGSQPWPFPQSVMIAFSATADHTQPLHIDKNELVDAQWFDKKDVIAATKVEGAVMKQEVAEKALERDPTLPLLIPPKRVIARTLIDSWLNNERS